MGDRLAKSQTLGRIPVNNQRIFYLGRELKTSGRSLHSLGVGRLGVNVLHVHSSVVNVAGRRKEISVDDDDDDDVVEVVEPTTSAVDHLRSKRVVELLDDDDDNEDAVAAASTRRKRRR